MHPRLKLRCESLILFSLLLLVLTGCASITKTQPHLEAPQYLASAAYARAGGDWTTLFNGKDLSGWYTFMPSQGIDRDPQGVVNVKNGQLHILGNGNLRRQEFGFVATRNNYKNYHLRLDYRWGSKRYGNRRFKPRDSGLLYHLRGGNRVWPQSAEYQIMQGGKTGDLWLLRPGRYDYATRQRGGAERAGWNRVELIVDGNTAVHILNGKVVAKVSNVRANQGRIALQIEGAEVFYRNIQIRSLASSTAPDDGATDPVLDGQGTSRRITLFNGGSTAAWRPSRGGQMWRVVGQALEVLPSGRLGGNDIETRQKFQDFKMSLLYMVPATPPSAPEQGRGNSGIYLQGRYELQVLDSFGRRLSGKNDAGAIYGVRDASRNASRCTACWNRYDITFKAARYQNGRKVAPARVTVYWNGVLVHNNVVIPGATRLGAPEGASPGPIRLQDHNHRVKYARIWIEPLN